MTTPTARDVALLVVSDRAAAGTRPDETAALLRPVIEAAGFALREVAILPDERTLLVGALRARIDRFALILTTGGTGVAPRDVTPEATLDVIERSVPGLVEEIRRRSAETNPKAIGSRAVAGIASRTLILNLPGRPAGAVEAFQVVAAVLPHLVAVLRGPVSDASHEAGATGPRDA